MAMRWRWPPDSCTPRSPTRVSQPVGQVGDELGQRRLVAARVSTSLARRVGPGERGHSPAACR